MGLLFAKVSSRICWEKTAYGKLQQIINKIGVISLPLVKHKFEYCIRHCLSSCTSLMRPQSLGMKPYEAYCLKVCCILRAHIGFGWFDKADTTTGDSETLHS